MSEFRDFEDRKEAERYALETGLPLGRRVKSPRLRHLLAPYHVGKFSPYHYERIEPMKPKTPKARPVRIELSSDTFTWFVSYADRKRRGRYLAAQFYAPDTTLEKVQEWVRNNPALTLIEEPTS